MKTIRLHTMSINYITTLFKNKIRLFNQMNNKDLNIYDYINIECNEEDYKDFITTLKNNNDIYINNIIQNEIEKA